MSGFDLAQTFFLDRQAVNDSEIAFITAVDLFFYSKPISGQTKTGIANPGVSVSICGVRADGTPDIKTASHIYSARVEYAGIVTDTAGNDSSVTTFTLRQPMPLITNRRYAVLVKFDGSDNDFKLWYNKSGENVLGTQTQTQVSSGKVDGYFFKITNGYDLTPERDADLAFRVKIARFTETQKTFKTKNIPYEILKVVSYADKFLGGEDVYQGAANGSGTIAITNTSNTVTGTGTSFNTYLKINDKIVITDGTSGNTDIVTVTAIANSTQLSVDRAPKFADTNANYFKTVMGKVHIADKLTDHILIRESTANSTLYFGAGNTIYGVDSGANTTISEIVNFTVNAVIPGYAIRTPFGTQATGTVNFANGAYSVSGTRKKDVVNGVRTLINNYDAVFASHTTEETAATPFETFNGEITFSTSNEYVSPYVREENLDVFVERYVINNSDTEEYLGLGTAQARYISKTAILRNEQFAEDLKVYLTAYRPFGSTIKVYAKFRNSEDNESFDLKDWTELLILNNDVYSNPGNFNSRVELAYSVPFFRSGTDITTSSGAYISFTTTEGSDEVTSATSLIQPSTFNALSGVANTTEVITTSSSHGLVNGDIVQYIVSPGNTVVTGLSNGSSYYVVNSTSSTTLQLSITSGGAAINITGTVSETGHTLIPAKAIVANTLVKVYSPILPDTYFVDVVTEANSSTFTVSKVVSNTSLVGTGFYVTKIDRPNSAFLDKQNQNVLTYFNRASARFEAYDSFAVKVVLLSADGVSIPFVDDVRAIAVSA